MTRSPGRLVGIAVGALLAVLVVCSAGYWRYASYVPPAPAFRPEPLVANAWQDCLAADKLLTPKAKQAEITLYQLRPPPDRTRGWRLVPLRQLQEVDRAAVPAVQRLRHGLKHPSLGRLDPAKGLHSREKQMARDLSRFLGIRCELERRAGHWDAALECGLDSVRLGHLITVGGQANHGLAGIAIQKNGLRDIDRLLDQVGADAAGAAAREIWEIDRHATTLADCLDRERRLEIAQLAAFLRYRSVAELAKILTMNGYIENERWVALQLALTPKRRILGNYQAATEILLARARLPYYARGPMPALPTDPVNQSTGFPREMDRAWAGISAQRRIFAARLALRAFRVRTQRLPDTLAELVPDYLPAVPQDPMAPAPLVYRVAKGQPLVYSRGPDGDDDGGRDLGDYFEADEDGDLVSLKRVRR